MKPANTPENLAKCTCGACPVYTECTKDRNEALYCARTPSECTLDETKKCICPDCPVHSENQLTGGYFCIDELKEEPTKEEQAQT